MGILSGLKPERVFEIFEEISAVPRGSGKTEKITKFCAGFAAERGLRFISDETGNVIIFKGGSAGRENEQPVILQGHLDMVWEKSAGSEICFETDPLPLKTDGESVWSDGTTLGGDDGIAVAMCLALLDDENASHPPLEVVLTVDEEVGMTGAAAIDCSRLSGKRMINIDSEDEKTLWVSCAGGERVNVLLRGKKIPASGKIYRLSVTGLHGGHSGTEIHRGYANANKLLGRVLLELSENSEIMISSVNGGKMGNAIPRESECVFYLLTDEGTLERTVEECAKKYGIIHSLTDPGLEMTLSEIGPEADPRAFNVNSTAKIIGLLSELPNGVVAMSEEIEGLTETSLNLGILKTEGDEVSFGFSVRSAKDEKRAELVRQLNTLAGIYGAEVEASGAYPAWEFRKNSPLQGVIKNAYAALNGSEMKVAAVHAGLECGLFCGKIPGLDCVSLGPDIFDIHTPQEKLSVPSVERVWTLIIKVLEDI